MPGDSVHIPESTNFGETLPAPSGSSALLRAVAAANTAPVTSGTPGAQRFGKYEVIGELGEGGMGRVYKAIDTELGRVVAVKVLRSTDPFECSRFRGEAEMIASLDHPNIVKVYDIATPPGGRPYIVLEFCEGGSLDKELGGNPIEPRRAAEMIETLARAVHVAHEKGILHRDLKPANVLRVRDKDKTLKLTDFGLAKEMGSVSGMTPSNAVMGTPSYMSPEQAAGKIKLLGRPSDVYGLGAILYELLTGRPPFRGVDMLDTLEQVQWAEPAPPSRLVPKLHRDLATICLKCLQKSPGRRYATASDLADDLRRWMDGETITARRAPSWERLVRQVKRRPWQAATVGVLVLMAGLVAVGLMVNAARERERKADAERQALREQGAAALQEAERKAAEERRIKDEAHAALLRARGERSRVALEAIREQVMNKDLKGSPGLHKLHGVLAEFYRLHIHEALQDDPNADRPKLAKLAYEIGEVAHRSGQFEEAEKLYDLARTLYTPMATADLEQRKRLGELAVKIARAQFDQNQDDKALATCDEAERLWTDMLKLTSGKSATNLQLAEIAHLRGEVCRRRSDTNGALDQFKRAIDLRRSAFATWQAQPVVELRKFTKPDDPLNAARRPLILQSLRDLGRGYGYSGDEYLRLNRVIDADRDYWESHQYRQKLTEVLADPQTPEDRADLEAARFQLARSWTNLANIQTRHRMYTTAKQDADKALKIREELFRTGPNNVEYRVDLYESLNLIAEFTLLENRNQPEKLKGELPKIRELLLDRAIDTEKAATTEEARSFRLREVLAAAYALRAEALADENKPAAREDAGHALRFLADARKLYPKHAKHQFQRAAVLALSADLDDAPPTDPRWQEALDELGRALDGGGCDKHPDDVKERRYFRKLKGDPRFEELFAKRRG